MKALPVQIEQMIESIRDKSTSPNVRHNQIQSLINVRDACSAAIFEYESRSYRKNNK